MPKNYVQYRLKDFYNLLKKIRKDLNIHEQYIAVQDILTQQTGIQHKEIVYEHPTVNSAVTILIYTSVIEDKITYQKVVRSKGEDTVKLVYKWHSK